MSNIATEQLMTILELSELFKIDEITVRRAVKKLFPELIKHGKKTYLNQYHVTKVKKEIETKTDKNVGLTTELEMIEQTYKVINWLTTKYYEEKEKNKYLQPKADSFNQLMDTSNLHRMDEVAQVVGIGKNTLYRKLREANIIRLQNGYNLPYQRYIDAGYLQLKETIKHIHEEKVSIPVIYATAKGIEYIRKLIS